MSFALGGGFVVVAGVATGGGGFGAAVAEGRAPAALIRGAVATLADGAAGSSDFAVGGGLGSMEGGSGSTIGAAFDDGTLDAGSTEA